MTFNVGPLHKINGITPTVYKPNLYKDILNKNLVEVVENMAFPKEMIIFQHNRDSKNTAKNIQK